MGGTGKLVAELHNLLHRAGVNVELGVDIEQIEQQGQLVTGAVATDGRRFTARAGDLQWRSPNSLSPDGAAGAPPQKRRCPIR